MAYQSNYAPYNFRQFVFQVCHIVRNARRALRVAREGRFGAVRFMVFYIVHTFKHCRPLVPHNGE